MRLIISSFLFVISVNSYAQILRTETGVEAPTDAVLDVACEPSAKKGHVLIAYLLSDGSTDVVSEVQIHNYLTPEEKKGLQIAASLVGGPSKSQQIIQRRCEAMAHDALSKIRAIPDGYVVFEKNEFNNILSFTVAEPKSGKKQRYLISDLVE